MQKAGIFHLSLHAGFYVFTSLHFYIFRTASIIKFQRNLSAVFGLVRQFHRGLLLSIRVVIIIVVVIIAGTCDSGAREACQNSVQIDACGLF